MVRLPDSERDLPWGPTLVATCSVARERREWRGDRRSEERVEGFLSLLYFLLSPLSCSIFGRFAAKNRGERI
jgi:hypothetical protein